MKHKYFVPPWAFIFLLILQTSFLPQTNQDKIKLLTEQSDAIITGKVLTKKSDWNENKSRIFTIATIEVEEYLKGNGNDHQVKIYYPGGEVGEVGEQYSHMPKLNDDEEVLLFMKKDKDEKSFKILNGEDGKLTLYKDNITGEKVTAFNKKVSSLKREIKDFIEKQ